jgi:hypothetical protein
MARPIPLAAPVTTANLFSDISFVSIQFCHSALDAESKYLFSPAIYCGVLILLPQQHPHGNKIPDKAIFGFCLLNFGAK